MASFNTNVDYNETRGAEINGVGWVFTGIATVTVGLKFYSRMDKTQRLGWDDFFIFLSWASSLVAMALASYAVTLGLGQHTAAVIAAHGYERYVLTAKWQIIAFPFNIGAFSFPNISIAILINKLLDPNNIRQRFLLGMSVLQVVIAMISIFVVFFQCDPPRMLWNPTIGGTCWSPDVFDGYQYFVSAYTTMTDIILAIVPVSVFWKLQMPLSTKVNVCIMMSLTLLSAIFTIVKATYLHLFTDHSDPLFNETRLVWWGLVEQNVVIVAASVPTLRPFFRKKFTSKKGTTTGNTSTSRSESNFKLSSNRKLSLSKNAPSLSEIPLDDRNGKSPDSDSNHSQHGIWETREVTVESDDERYLEEAMSRQYRESVPANLRTQRP